MIIYNITVKVDWSIAEDWLAWSRAIYIPQVLATGCFSKHQLVRLLEVDETDGPTYAIQYFCGSPGEYKDYVKKYAPVFSSILYKQWGDKCLSFGTLMEIV